MPKNEADFLDMLARAHPSHPAPCCRPKSITSQTGALLEYRKMYRAVLVQHGGFDPVTPPTVQHVVDVVAQHDSLISPPPNSAVRVAVGVCI